jgi:hypothetical protein
MKFRRHMSAALVLAAGSVASAQSLSTGFTGNYTTSLTAANGGNYFDVTALNPGGLTINSFDVSSIAPSGTPIDVSVYYRPGSYQGFHTSSAGWTLLGSTTVTAAGTYSTHGGFGHGRSCFHKQALIPLANGLCGQPENFPYLVPMPAAYA